MNWKRALLGGLLAEILVLVLISPVAFVVGLDKLGDPATVPPAIGYSIVIASFIAPIVLTQWVAKRLTSQFVVHGFLVGFTAFVIYMIPMTLSGESQPPIYWVAHAAKILGGLTGGLVAARRHASRGTSVTV
jgi:membrane associated rhomboid family serine protease